MSLLDLAPTIAWSLGVDVPDAYSGRVLGEAFANGVEAPHHRMAAQISSDVPIASSWPMTTSPASYREILEPVRAARGEVAVA